MRACRLLDFGRLYVRILNNNYDNHMYEDRFLLDLTQFDCINKSRYSKLSMMTPEKHRISSVRFIKKIDKRKVLTIARTNIVSNMSDLNLARIRYVREKGQL